jgi:hypothetical protein
MLIRLPTILAMVMAGAIVAGCAGDPNGSPLPSVVAPKKGKTLFVASVGNAGGGTSCNSPYRVASGPDTADEIQETITQAESIGATTVHICAGEYVLGHRLIVNTSLRIVGSGIDETILDGNHEVSIIDGVGAVVDNNPGRIELSDISLRNGAAESLDDGLSDLGLILMTGGAVTAWSITTTRVAFVGNGGGVCGGAVSLLGNLPALLEGSQLYDLSPRGREIYFNNARSTFTDTEFTGNTAYIAGGAVGGMSLNVVDVPAELQIALFYTEVFFCGAPPISVVRSAFNGNEALVGGAIYSGEPRTAMEIGNDVAENQVASARPFTARRMKELYELPSLLVRSSSFSENRATGRNILGIAALGGIGGGAIFTSGVANISRTVFSGNGSPAVPANEYDVTVVGGAVAACGYVGTSNTYEENRAMAGGALGVGLLPVEIFSELCYGGALPALAESVRLDRFHNEVFRDNVAEIAGGAIWSIARGRFSGAAGLRFSGNSGGLAQSVAFSAASCGSRDSQQLISSWERAGRYIEGAAGEVTCTTDFAPMAGRGPAIRYPFTPVSVGPVDLSALNPAALITLRQEIESLLHR